MRSVSKKPLIIANWKMHPRKRADALTLFSRIKEKIQRIRNVDIVICPPSIYLHDLLAHYSGKRIAFGGQDAHWEKEGSYTGSVSMAQLADSGATYIIIGHSERRAAGETNAEIAQKVHAALAARLTPIVCVGEDERDGSGAYLAAIQKEVTESLAGIGAKQLGKIILAYEPRWAIGKSAEDALPADELHATVVLLRKILTELHDRTAAHRTRILYGGSAEPTNADALMRRGEVDGLLVGHASLKAQTFANVVDAALRGTQA